MHKCKHNILEIGHNLDLLMVAYFVLFKKISNARAKRTQRIGRLKVSISGQAVKDNACHKGDRL